ncbi:MAG: nitrilase family protein [Acidobacteria bacterium]|nr:MAG: nitrilase family protein [Acidobacteriota bacterium]
MKIALLQTKLFWEDPAKNCEHLIALLAQSAPCDLLIMPELWASGFTMNPDIHRACTGVSGFLGQLAAERNLFLLGGIPEYNRQTQKQENRLVLFNRKGEKVGFYSKRKLFTYAGEHKSYGHGDQQVIWQIEDFKIAPLICYELRFPELCRHVAPKADLMVFSANWPQSRQSHWDRLLPARAIENQAFVVGVNRLGLDGNGLYYSGHSVVYSPQGELLLNCESKEGIFSVEIDASVVHETRKKFPFLNDMTN